jgi:hypothetical protein
LLLYNYRKIFPNSTLGRSKGCIRGKAIEMDEEVVIYGLRMDLEHERNHLYGGNLVGPDTT